MTVETLRKTHALFEKLIEHLQEQSSQDEIDLVKRAYAFAENHYAHIDHPAGKSYIEYTVEVATHLVELLADSTGISAALISPPPLIAEEAIDDLKKQFKGEDELLALVGEILSLGHLEWNIWPTLPESNESEGHGEILRKMFLLTIDETRSEDHEQISRATMHFQKKERQIENLIKMFLAVATDIRALIIKLADHFLFMKSLKELPKIQKDALQYTFLAKITLTIYAPLADRLGMWRLKSELEDMSFRLLEPNAYTAIAKQLEAKKEQRKKYINDIILIIRAELEAFGIKSEISGRAKHIYSIYQKMDAKQLAFEQINDLLGIRIIVDKKEDCYLAQAIIHEFWPPIITVYEGKPGRDWIARPKENLYQSLHTTVNIKDKIVEIQIRTHEMHEIAEYGLAAAHWRYKESKSYRKGKTPRVSRAKDQIWDEQLAKLRKSLAEESGSKSLGQRHLLKNQIFVITPEGHVIDLLDGAKPLDFAYRIHTDLGHRYTGAKVNGRIVRLDYKLKNGDIVELITSRARKGPNPEWLAKSKDEEGNSHYVFARTPQARSKITNWLNKYNEEYKSRHNEMQKPKHDDMQKPGTRK